MKINYLIVSTLVALTLLVGACAHAATPTSQPPTAAAAMTGPATVNVGKNSKYNPEFYSNARFTTNSGLAADSNPEGINRKSQYQTAGFQ